MLTATAGGAVYVGGRDELGTATDVARAFEFAGAKSGTWFVVSSMNQRRAYLSVAVWRTNILAVGGEDHKKM